MREVGGSVAARVLGLGRLPRCHKPGLKLRHREGDSPPGAAGPAPAPGSADFSAGAGLPWLRSDKSHACTRGESPHPEKPPDPTRTKKEKKKTSNIKI